MFRKVIPVHTLNFSMKSPLRLNFLSKEQQPSNCEIPNCVMAFITMASFCNSLLQRNIIPDDNHFIEKGSSFLQTYTQTLLLSFASRYSNFFKRTVLLKLTVLDGNARIKDVLHSTFDSSFLKLVWNCCKCLKAELTRTIKSISLHNESTSYIFKLAMVVGCCHNIFAFVAIFCCFGFVAAVCLCWLGVAESMLFLCRKNMEYTQS